MRGGGGGLRAEGAHAAAQAAARREAAKGVQGAEPSCGPAERGNKKAPPAKALRPRFFAD